MVSALLDELPCLIDEADELMARLSCHITLLKPHCKGLSASTSVEVPSTNQTLATDSMEDLKYSPSSPHMTLSTQSFGKNRSMAELRQSLGSVDMDGIIKFFARQFLTMQSMSIEKMNANLPTGDFERRSLHSVAASIYQLMKRLHHWQQAAWESLTRFFADNSNSESSLLTFDTHPQLTRLVLATVAKYVKVNLLWTSFKVIPGLLALYSFLHHVQTTSDSTFATKLPHAQYSPLEHTDHRVREFVLHFGTAPLLAIQHDFQLQVADKGASLAALALSCFKRYETCRDLAKLRHLGVFDLEALVSGAYASHSSLPDLLNAAEIEDWVICAVLCVPHQLQNGDRNASFSPRSMPSSPSSLSSPTSPTNALSHFQLWDFMETIARDRLVLALHRSHLINLHDLLYQQITSSLSAVSFTTGALPNSSMPSFGSSRSSVPLKKTINSISKYALRNGGENHRQRREVTTWLLRNCVRLMEHNPGLVAPSFPLLLSALAIARDEIEWAMCHGIYNGFKAPLLPTHIKAKHLQRVATSFSGIEQDLADLLTYSHHLRGLVEQHSAYLADYYQLFLVNGDANGIAYTIQELLATNESTSSPKELQSLLEGFLDSERYRVNTSSPPRVTWVREWRQTNAHLVTGVQLPLLDVLRARMECAVRHTQYICVNAQMLEHAANFSKCWWFRDVIFESCFKQVMVTAPTSSIGLLKILSSLAAGDYILDELIDTEEAEQQLEKMLQRMDQMQTALVTQLELGLEGLVRRDINLQRDERSISHEEKPEQVEGKVTASSRRLSSFSRVQSSQVQRPSNAEVRLASPTSSVLGRNNDHNNPPTGRKTEHFVDENQFMGLVQALLDYIKTHPRGNVVKIEIVNRVQASFIRFVRGLVTISAGAIDKVALRCSLKDGCEEVRCFLRATQRLFGGDDSESVNIDKASLGGAVQAMLSKVLADECRAMASALPQDKRLLECSTDAPRLIDKELQQWSLVDRIAWLFVCLVTRRCHPSSSSSSVITSSPPLLVSVRKGCFILAPGAPRELDPRDYTDRDALHHLVGLIGLAGVESVSSTVANLVVAQTLKLRSSIEAEHAALAFMDMALSGGSSADVVLASAQARALDDIATQLVQIGTAAYLLQLLHGLGSSARNDAWEARVAARIQRELQHDPDRRATWTRLLPVACSAAFHSGVWRRTSYLSSVEATDTNAHLMGLAMALLLPPPHSSRAVHRCAVAALRRASTCACGSEPPTATRSKLPLQLDPASSQASARPLLAALQLLLATAGEDPSGPHGAALGELDAPALERLLPHAVLVLHSAA
ncbi:unnamed protein product [Phytophthora lilii]|uniref:Unnamed protein product n=1 Tax=Phytophthora lilii TaxID=2077276 RepID=A0A9W6TEW9_9STRA|nr:unnamed protein product [Phytophthora lilii]